MLHDKLFQVLGTINRILLAVSHSGNLVIYCMSNQSFRKVLYRQICRIKHPEPINSMHTTRSPIMGDPLLKEHSLVAQPALSGPNSPCAKQHMPKGILLKSTSSKKEEDQIINQRRNQN